LEFGYYTNPFPETLDAPWLSFLLSGVMVKGSRLYFLLFYCRKRRTDLLDSIGFIDRNYSVNYFLVFLESFYLALLVVTDVPKTSLYFATFNSTLFVYCFNGVLFRIIIPLSGVFSISIVLFGFFGLLKFYPEAQLV